MRFEGSIVVETVGNRTLVHTQAAISGFGHSRALHPPLLHSRDHRDMVLIWIVFVFVVEAEEVTVVQVRRGLQMFRSIGSP
jgi:hypothetical protein